MVAFPPPPGRIYISHRGQDTRAYARLLHDRLADRFGARQVLMDVDSIEPGADFVEGITAAVRSSDVVLVLIDDGWLPMTDADGQRRLDDPDDFVRLEIEAALARNVRVIPILVDGARMPRADELPPSLAPLARQQALQLSPSRWDLDTSRLLDVLDRTLADTQTQRMTNRDGRAAPAPPEAPAGPGSEQGRQSRRWRWPWRARRWSRAEPSTPQAEPTEEPGQQRRPEPDDDVSFTAGYPGVVTPHIWYSLSVYVHLGRVQAEADQLIADESRSFGMHPAASKAASRVPLPKGTLLRVSPDVPGVEFNPPAQELRWLEDLQQIAFRLRASPEAAGHAVLGAVEVYAGPLLVAQVPLSIHVRGVGEPTERESQDRAEASAASTARLFSSVFASYAHEDDHVVRAFAEAYRALGIDVLMDKASLEAGDDWQQVLSRLIEEADLFQLFWSDAASRSSYVAEEWQRALLLQDRKGERFIRPLYWSIPWPPPPAQLAHLHFASLDLAALSSVP